jgi:hypothetical protein
MNHGEKIKSNLGVFRVTDWHLFLFRSSLIDSSDCDVNQLIAILQITSILTDKLVTHASSE